jgi:hypothetical protein
MELASVLEESRELVLAKWRERIIATYPQATSEFLRRQGDPFRNPLGHAIATSVGPIYDQVVSAMDAEQLLPALDRLIRIRSVQDFRPSEALAFVFQLKAILREVLAQTLHGDHASGALTALESRIDQVALLAFDKYTQCREKLQELKYNELKTKTG